MRIVMGSDHGGFVLKNELISRLKSNYDVSDTGAYTYDAADDYPDFALKIALEIVSGKADRGIIICGSGVGACIAANKVPGIKACVCHDTYSAHQGVEHDDMNVLCIGARVVGTELAYELVTAFLTSQFSGEEHHQRRVNKVLAIEKEYSKGGLTCLSKPVWGKIKTKSKPH